MSSYLFRGGPMLDTVAGVLLEGHELLVEGNEIKELTAGRIRTATAEVIDLDGRVLMPGLIDAHVHIYVDEFDLRALETQAPSLTVARAGRLLREMLYRGFTSVRDTAGADWGIKHAVESGHITGPRLFVCGRAISQTGGHGDGSSNRFHPSGCSCSGSGLDLLFRLADGVPAVLQAARDELRKGADFIKIMISGGVASPHDPLLSLQYTLDEIDAAVAVARSWNTYVAAHGYSGEAIYRAVERGVRTVEHGNLIDERAAGLMAERGAFLVPTLVTYERMGAEAAARGWPRANQMKNQSVLDAGLRSIERCRRAQVQIGFGTDLLGWMHEHQGREFLIRAEVQPAAEIIHSATIVNARILNMEGRLGVLAAGALADLIVVDRDPLVSIDVFADPLIHINLIMKDGRLYKNTLS